MPLKRNPPTLLVGGGNGPDEAIPGSPRNFPEAPLQKFVLELGSLELVTINGLAFTYHNS